MAGFIMNAMLVPSFLYGTYGEAKVRCGKVAKRLAKGDSWADALANDELVDTVSSKGFLVLSGPNPILGSENHFHLYLLLTLIRNTDAELLDGEVDRVFESSLNSPWGTLGALSPANLIWIFPKRRYPPLLHATLQFWDLLYAEGDRYTVGSVAGQDLWTVQTNLKYVLANRGVESAVLNGPLPIGGPASLML